MCEGYENAIAEQCWDKGFAEGWKACRRHAIKIIKWAMSEVGIPQTGYPANVANAYGILEKGMQQIPKEPDDEDYVAVEPLLENKCVFCGSTEEVSPTPVDAPNNLQPVCIACWEKFQDARRTALIEEEQCQQIQ